MTCADLYLNDDERQPCEVWTRVMGYHRPVESFNAGKQGEHAERCFFKQPALTETAQTEKPMQEGG